MRIIKIEKFRRIHMNEPDNYCELVNETRTEKPDPSKISKLHNLNTGRDICDRLFESYIIDLRIAIKQYYNNCFDDLSFVDRLEQIIDNLKSLAPSGDIRKVLERANLVMLEKITSDIRHETTDGRQKTEDGSRDATD